MNRTRLAPIALLVAVLAALGPLALVPAQARVQTGSSAPRVAVIVGPVGSLTEEYRRAGRAAAAEARRWTSDVVTVFSPYATWPAVKNAIQGASVVVYLGHGNGWPSPHRSALYDVTQNGFGLNPVAGAGDGTHQYFGAAYLRREIRLAPGAVILLHRLCYASGNSEPGVPEGTIDLARQRIDNFAAGFIDSGAGAVVADAFAPPATYIHRLLGQGVSAMTAWRESPTAHGHTSSFTSVRTPGALDFMDPDTTSSGFYRSIVLSSTTAAIVGPGGPGTGQGTGVPSAIEPTFISPTDPPPPSLAAVGATVGAPVFSNRPIAASMTTLSVPLSLPRHALLPTGLQIGVRWTSLDGPTLGATSGGSTSAGPTGPTASPSATPVSSPGATASPGAFASPSPAPTATASAGPSAAPSADPAASPTASPDPTGPTASAGPIGPTVSDLLAGVDQVVPEQSSTAVDVTPALVQGNALNVPLQMPTVPGRYRLVVTLHDANGVALDAETQALVPALLVRVAGPVEVTYSAPARVRALPGGQMRLLVTVTNAGTLAWTATPTRTSEDGPRALAHSAVLVGRWVALDVGGSTGAAGAVDAPFEASPGGSAMVSLRLRAPDAPGLYLIVLDVRSPLLGSLAARGATPATLIVQVVAPSS